MKPAERRDMMMAEVAGVLARAKKASRFLSAEHKAKLAEAEKFLKKAGANAASFSATSRNVDKAALAETFEFIREARNIAAQIDAEGERLAEELKNI